MINLIIFKLFLFQYDLMIEKNRYFFREKNNNLCFTYFLNTTKE